MAGVHGDEEGVDILGAVVVVDVAGDGAAGTGDAGHEIEGDVVAACDERVARYDEVTVD